MFQKYKKLIIALLVIASLPLIVLMCCDVSITRVGDVSLEETETETEISAVPQTAGYAFKEKGNRKGKNGSS